MAGSLISIDQAVNDQAMAMNAILEQWEVQYARFVNFPPLSSDSSAPATHHQPLLVPRSDRSRKIRRGGVWCSSSSSAAAGSASLKLIAISSTDVVLNLSLHCKILVTHFPFLFLNYNLDALRIELKLQLSAEYSGFFILQEEHRISKLHFTWPQVSCVSGFPARGARTVFVQKFALRFITIYEAENFIYVLKEILYSAPNKIQGAEFNSEISSQSEFVPSIGLPYRIEEDQRHTTTADTSTTFRAEEDWRPTATADTSTHQGPASLNYEVGKYFYAKESMQNCEAEEFLSDFPPSFTSFLKNCCPAAEKSRASIPEEIDLKSQIARYLEDSSFQDMLIKVEKVINELGDYIIQ
ncbi:hypothetical protein ACH5RR_035597 [Cinchona calisaya]|uniref:Poor homologous synapsis 1 PH domain-containing protein n=1 Tax=Cinchona calisaya TaxID=153742 RepID=A0ABD2Y0Y5_9GENT